MSDITNHIGRRIFGKTGRKLTMVGLGGEGVLRTFGEEGRAEQVIREAVNQGIGYFDSARVYAGSESYYGLVWPRERETRSHVFQTSKSASRDKRGALADLETTLEVMGVEYLDLWQIHDVRTERDLEVIGGPGGALEAFIEAREAGKVRHIGVTGHHDPAVLSAAVSEWPVDSVLAPVNPVEGAVGGFLDQTLPLARKKGVAVIGMKILGASNYVFPQYGVTAEKLLQYALSQDITVAIVGCSTPDHVRTLAEAGRDFQPMDADEQKALVDLFRPNAPRLAYYRGKI